MAVNSRLMFAFGCNTRCMKAVNKTITQTKLSRPSESCQRCNSCVRSAAEMNTGGRATSVNHRNCRRNSTSARPGQPKCASASPLDRQSWRSTSSGRNTAAVTARPAATERENSLPLPAVAISQAQQRQSSPGHKMEINSVYNSASRVGLRLRAARAMAACPCSRTSLRNRPCSPNRATKSTTIRPTHCGSCCV